jgi:hypothetical protein
MDTHRDKYGDNPLLTAAYDLGHRAGVEEGLRAANEFANGRTSPQLREALRMLEHQDPAMIDDYVIRPVWRDRANGYDEVLSLTRDRLWSDWEQRDVWGIPDAYDVGVSDGVYSMCERMLREHLDRSARNRRRDGLMLVAILLFVAFIVTLSVVPR